LLAKPTFGHNHLFFRRHAIEASLACGRVDEERRHATALASHAAAEAMPYTEAIVRRAVLFGRCRRWPSLGGKTSRDEVPSSGPRAPNLAP
jgi:hypothetical protein